MKKRNIEKFKTGIKRFREKKILLLLPGSYTVLLIVLAYIMQMFFRKMGEPFTWKIIEIALYIFITEIFVAGIMKIIYIVGTPREGKKKEGELIDIGFVNKDKEPPLLISRKKEGKGIVFEFYSPGIPFYQYEDHKKDIENAMNIKVIDVVPGKDMQHVIIKALEKGGETPRIIKWKDDYLSREDFELVLGESFFGVERIDISITPHTLIGGGTGSGKTNLNKLILAECIKKGAIVYLADFKGGVDYPGVWNKVCTIISEPEELDKQLLKVLLEMEERRNLFVKEGVSNLGEYNRKTGLKLPRIIIACDEIAEVLDKTGADKEQKMLINQIESKLSTIARQGRAFGEHLILATQRPDSDIIKGQIKNNLGHRICGRADKVLSQIILDNSEGADRISSDDQGMFYTNTKVLFKAYYWEDDCLKGGFND